MKDFQIIIFNNLSLINILTNTYYKIYMYRILIFLIE